MDCQAVAGVCVRQRVVITVLVGALCVLVLAAVTPTWSHAAVVSGAVFTTIEPSENQPQTHCLNGPGVVNCNLFDEKQYVWLTGGPAHGHQATVSEGDYYFAVLAPGGQGDPNDGSAENLSDDFDTWRNRTFHVDGDGNVRYTGIPSDDETSHVSAVDARGGELVRLLPYADTTNLGGVYILAVCSAETIPVDPSACKYDAFKVQSSDEGDTPDAPTLVDLAVGTSAQSEFMRTFGWTLTNTVSPTLVKQVGGSATLNYSIKAYKNAGTDSEWKASGDVQIFNSNQRPISGVMVSVAVTDDVAAQCTVDNGANLEIASETTTVITFVCTWSQQPESINELAVATVKWPEVNSPNTVADAEAELNFEHPTVRRHNCTDIVNEFAATAAVTVHASCVESSNETANTTAMPLFECVTIPDTATLTASDDTSYARVAKAPATLCGPAKSGALTMGFWQNKNGQAIIAKYSGAYCQTLRSFLIRYQPFADLTATRCNALQSWTMSIIKNASAAGTSMNSMLRAQMLATALNVYFSDASLGGKRIAAGAPIGSIVVDATRVCFAFARGACGGYMDTSLAFNFSPSMSVSNLLAVAAANSSVGGGVWYGNNKFTQERAKNAFDAINNTWMFRS